MLDYWVNFFVHVMVMGVDNFKTIDNFYQWTIDNCQSWQKYNRTKSGTKDDYKAQLIEKTQFFYTIEDMTNIISNFKLKDYIYNSGSNMNYDRLQKAYENHKVDVKKITAEDERVWEDDMIEHDN